MREFGSRLNGEKKVNLEKWNELLKIQPASEKEEPIIIKRFMSLIKKYVPKDSKILVLGASVPERERLLKEGYQNVTCINLYSAEGILKMDMHDLKFKKESFDVVIAKNVVEHSFSPWLLFLEVRSVLRKGGLFVFSIQKIDMPWNYVIEHPFLVNSLWLDYIRNWFGFREITYTEYKGAINCIWRKNEDLPYNSLGKINWHEFLRKWEERFH